MALTVAEQSSEESLQVLPLQHEPQELSIVMLTEIGAPAKCGSASRALFKVLAFGHGKLRDICRMKAKEKTYKIDITLHVKQQKLLIMLFTSESVVFLCLYLHSVRAWYQFLALRAFFQFQKKLSTVDRLRLQVLAAIIAKSRLGHRLSRSPSLPPARPEASFQLEVKQIRKNKALRAKFHAVHCWCLETGCPGWIHCCYGPGP